MDNKRHNTYCTKQNNHNKRRILQDKAYLNRVTEITFRAAQNSASVSTPLITNCLCSFCSSLINSRSNNPIKKISRKHLKDKQNITQVIENPTKDQKNTKYKLSELHIHTIALKSRDTKLKFHVKRRNIEQSYKLKIGHQENSTTQELKNAVSTNNIRLFHPEQLFLTSYAFILEATQSIHIQLVHKRYA